LPAPRKSAAKVTT